MHFKGTEKAMLRLPHTAGIIVIRKIIFENIILIVHIHW